MAGIALLTVCKYTIRMIMELLGHKDYLRILMVLKKKPLRFTEIQKALRLNLTRNWRWPSYGRAFGHPTDALTDKVQPRNTAWGRPFCPWQSFNTQAGAWRSSASQKSRSCRALHGETRECRVNSP